MVTISDRIKPFIPGRYPVLDADLKNYLSEEFNKAKQADQTIREVIQLLDTTATPLVSAANDAAAAVAGVPLHGLYHTSGAVKMRLV